ncbi:MAG: type II CAAX prenyl endopeptidase Rce1 family protein [Bacteroidales bacterium]
MGKMSFKIKENPADAFVALVALVVVGMVLSGLAFAAISFVIPPFREILYHGAAQSPSFLRAMVAVNMPVMFLLPAMFVVGKYRPGRFREVTQIGRLPVAQMVLLAIVAIAVSQPALNLIGEWNKHLSLPDSFGGLMDWIRRTEADAELVSNQMVETTSAWALMANLLVMALLPGFCEEFLFRGVIQPIFHDWFGRKHLAIWATAFVFSFIHFQFFGFIPRLLLGAMLGYIVMYSGSLWTGVLMHTLNNALVVIVIYLQFNHHLSHEIDSLGTGDTAWVGLSGMALTVVIYLGIIKKSKLKTY